MFPDKVQMNFQKHIALHFCSKTSVTYGSEKYCLMSVQVENNRFWYCLTWWSKGFVEKPWKQLLQRWGRLASLSPSEKKGLLRRVELCGVYLCPLGHFKQRSSSYVASSYTESDFEQSHNNSLSNYQTNSAYQFVYNLLYNIQAHLNWQMKTVCCCDASI